MAKQLTFDWPTGVALGIGDFFVTPANRLAYDLIQSPDDWPGGKLILTGPPGSGKSHLARVFAGIAGADIHHAEALPADLPDTALVIEAVHTLPPGAEERLFHLHNHMAAQGLPLLLTARTPPSRWQIALPDLASRMQAATCVGIEEPDDLLLEALLMKLFADRQVMPEAQVIRYIATRIERSFDAAARAVDALDRESLTQGRPVTKPLARPVLDSLARDMG